MSEDLFDLLVDTVHWSGRTADRLVEGLGLEGGLVDRGVSWLTGEADIYAASILAFVVLFAWTILFVGLASWMDRLARARVEGRMGPTYGGVLGLLQELADQVKLKLKKRPGQPSSAAAAFSLAMVMAALAILPLGPWGRLVDPTWGLMMAATLIVLSTVPLALVAPRGRRMVEVAESAGSGVVLVLAVVSSVLVAGSGRSGDVVAFQEEHGIGLVLVPLGLALHLMVMYWESQRLARVRAGGRARELWPGPHRASTRFVVAARYSVLAILGSIAFLGGWLGPMVDGLWWTVAKAIILMVVVSVLSAAMPIARPGEVAHSIRRRWLPVAAINLVLVAGILEVMA